jgi:hypothetical protein
MFWTEEQGSTRANFAATGLRLEKGNLKDQPFLKQLGEAGDIKPVIDRSYPLELAVEDHSYVEKCYEKGHIIKTSWSERS